MSHSSRNHSPIASHHCPPPRHGPDAFITRAFLLENPIQTGACSAFNSTLAGMALSVAVCAALWPHAREAGAILAAQDDPAALSDIQINSALRSNQALLAQNIEELIELEARTARIKEEFASGKRTFYSQADDDAVRQLLFKYLTHRSALLNSIPASVRERRSR